ncbi:MAG: cyclic nucleotide-binding domain-containing protein [Myxococcota bacterium]
MQIAAAVDEAADRVFALFRSIEALTGLDDEAIRGLAALARVGWVDPGTVVVREGDPGDAMFLVADGRVELRVAGVVVETIGPGRGIGLVQLLSGGVRTETAVTVTRCRLVRLSRAVFQDYAARHPAVERAVHEIVRVRVRALHLSALLDPLLGGIDPALRAEVIARTRWLELKRGDVLYRTGDPADALYMVVSGRLRCDRGTEGVIEIGRGDLQGEVSLLAGTARTSTVTALRDCLIARVDGSVFQNLLARAPELSLALARSLAGRVAAHRTRHPSQRGCLHLAFVPVTGPSSPGAVSVDRLVRALAAHLAPFGRTIVLDVDAVRRHGVLDNADRLAADHPSWIRFQAWLDGIAAEHAFVLYVGGRSAPGWTRRCVDGADRVVLVADAAAEIPDGFDADRAVRPHDAPRVLALVHPADATRPVRTADWLARIPVERHFHVRCGIAEDEARLARSLAGRAIGLTLGGGGARGLAHIGVIRAMRELGIPIDHVGGTSMGAIIAAQCALGLSPTEMVALNARLARLRPFSDYTLPVISVLRTRRIEATARMAFGATEIEDLWLPFFAVSTNLTTASMVVHDRGPVWIATRASGSLPGIAVPVLVANQLLVDGGVLNNIPADVMRDRVGGQVVAVNVSPRVDSRFELDRVPGPWRYLRDRVAGTARAAASPSIVDILLRTTTLASSRHAERMRGEVDLLLEPPVDRFGLLEFHRILPIVEAGYRYALGALADRSLALQATA